MKKCKGVTLIEMLIVTSITTIVILVGITLFLLGNKSFAQQRNQSEIVAKARITMDYLTRSIRKAEVVSIEDNTLIIDSVEIRLIGEDLFEGDKVVLSSIETFLISETDEEINLVIVILNDDSDEYRVSSVIYRR